MVVNDVHANWGHVKAKEHDMARHPFLSVAPPPTSPMVKTQSIVSQL